MKRCPDCKEEKETICFGKETSNKDGLRSICKPCNSLRALKWHNNNVEHVNAREREFHKKDPSKNNSKNKRWRTKNPEKQAAIAKRSYNKRDIEKTKKQAKISRDKNKDSINKRQRGQYDKNKEKLRPTRKKWEKENSDKRAAIVAKRRAIKIQATPKHLTEEDYSKIKLFYTLSRKMTKETGIKHEVDHIIPLNSDMVSGFHHWNNLQVLPRVINREKSNNIRPDIIGFFPEGFGPN